MNKRAIERNRRGHIVLNEWQEKDIMQMREQKISWRKIIAIYNEHAPVTHCAMICYFNRKKNGQIKNTKSPITDAKIDKIIELKKAGLTLADISVNIGVSVNIVRVIIRKNGLGHLRGQARNSNEVNILSLHEQGLSVEEIKISAKVSDYMIREVLASKDLTPHIKIKRTRDYDKPSKTKSAAAKILSGNDYSSSIMITAINILKGKPCYESRNGAHFIDGKIAYLGDLIKKANEFRKRDNEPQLGRNEAWHA